MAKGVRLCVSQAIVVGSRRDEEQKFNRKSVFNLRRIVFTRNYAYAYLMLRCNMRTTIDIDASALDAIRDLALVEKRSIGKVLEELVFEALRSRAGVPLPVRNGIPLLLRDGSQLVTEETIQRIRDEEGL